MMYKIKAVWAILCGQLTEQEKYWKGKAQDYYVENKKLKIEIQYAEIKGEALAKGDSVKIATLALKSMKVDKSYYCAFCDRVTLHYLSGYCLQCGTK